MSDINSLLLLLNKKKLEADDEDEESPSNGGIPSASPSKGRNRDAVNENKVVRDNC